MTATQAELGDLCGLIARLTVGRERFVTPVPGLLLFRREAPTEPLSVVYEPSVCMVVQGRKRVLLGGDTYVYDSRHYLITSVHLPTTAEVLEASTDLPCLGLRMNLDLLQVAQMMVERGLPAPPSSSSPRGMATGEVTAPLVNAIRRLVDLIEAPTDIPILAPLTQREILYRLLVGDQGHRLREIATVGSRSHQIADVVEWLRTNFVEALRVEDLASRASMSTSAFHQHFRSLTGLSPLQYQKQLRLSEARRLMLVEHLDATGAARQVGYESPSQFSREYSRLFGAPPLRDIAALRKQAALGSA